MSIRQEKARRIIETHFRKTIVSLKYNKKSQHWEIMFADEPLVLVTDYWLETQ